MKTILLSLLVCLVASFNYQEKSTIQSSKAVDLFLEFEQNTTWDAVDESWKNVREKWGTSTTNCKTAKCLSEQLITFETYLKWGAVSKEWAKRRDSWLSDCGSVATYSQFAKLMIELETNIKWEAVSDDWKKRRESWLKESASIK